MPALSDAHVLVTGGSSGIGLAFARRAVARGARVSLLAREATRLDGAGAELRAIGGTVATAAADVADAARVATAIDALRSELGPVDVAVTSAGDVLPGYFEQLSDSVFERLMAVNYFGTLHVARAVVPDMVRRRRGSVVGVSSAAGLVGVFGYTAYSPTKFAVRGFLESLRAELEPRGVHVGCVFPPDTDTPQLAREDELKPPETRAISGRIKPLSADRVAASIVRGIERERFWIVPDRQTALLVRAAGLAPRSLARMLDRQVRRARSR